MQNTATIKLSPNGGNTKGAEIYKEEIFNEYLQLKKCAARTREGIIKSVRRFVEWCESENLTLTEVSYNDITAYVNHCKQRGNKQSTIKKTVLNIKRYYTFLNSLSSGEGRGEVDNPCTNVDIQNVKRKTLYETFTPEELEMIYKNFANAAINKNGTGANIIHKRNKVIAGLIIYQGIRVQELAQLKVSDINMREGKIRVEGAGKTQGRELKLEAHQVYEMMDYINETRKMLLAISGKQTDKLFTSTGSSERFSNLMRKITEQLNKQQPRLKDIKQIRASVITNWLKVHNIRKVQQMAGHRYVSSTESYQANNMDDLKEDVNRYHPLG